MFRDLVTRSSLTGPSPPSLGVAMSSLKRKRIDVLQPNGDLELPELSKSKRVAGAAPQIVRLTGARRFVLKEKRICVPGSLELRRQVARYVNVLLNEEVPEDMEHDMLRIFVTKKLRPTK